MEAELAPMSNRIDRHLDLWNALDGAALLPPIVIGLMLDDCAGEVAINGPAGLTVGSTHEIVGPEHIAPPDQELAVDPAVVGRVAIDVGKSVIRRDALERRWVHDTHEPLGPRII